MVKKTFVANNDGCSLDQPMIGRPADQPPEEKPPKKIRAPRDHWHLFGRTPWCADICGAP